MTRRSSFLSAWSRAPLIRVVIPFIVGLLIGGQIRVDPRPLGMTALVACMAWFAAHRSVRRYRFRWIRGATLMIGLVLFGMFRQALDAPLRVNADLIRHRTEAVGWRVEVVEVISSGERTVRTWAEVDAMVDASGARAARGRLMVVLMKDPATGDPVVGDQLLLTARVDTIERVPEPGAFDQRSWAASYGVYHQCFASQGRWLRLDRPRGFRTLFEDARHGVARWLASSSLDPRERGLVKAVLLGIRDELDQEQKAAFARSGTMHVLAVSGSHVALIYGVLIWGLRRLGTRRVHRVARSFLVLIVLWAYAGLTGATPSVLRATITFTLFCLSDMADRRPEPVNSLAGAAFLLLLWDPVMLGQLSFQLSFLAVLGIAMFYRSILRSWSPPTRVLWYLWSLFSVSLAAQAFTTPLALLSFGAFPVWFLPANLLIVALIALGVYGGVLFLILYPIPMLGEMATGFMVIVLKAIDGVTWTFAHLPGAYPAVRIDPWQCLGLYALLLFSSAWLFERWNRARTGTIALVAVLLFTWAWRAHMRNDQERLVVYDRRDGLTCAVENGRDLLVYTDTLDIWTARKVDRHQRAIGAERVVVEKRLPKAIAFGDLRVLFLGQDATGVTAPGLFKPTCVILSGDVGPGPGELQARLHPKDGFVLASTLRPALRIRFRDWFKEHDIPVHDVRTQGAYVRER